MQHHNILDLEAIPGHMRPASGRPPIPGLHPKVRRLLIHGTDKVRTHGEQHSSHNHRIKPQDMAPMKPGDHGTDLIPRETQQPTLLSRRLYPILPLPLRYLLILRRRALLLVRPRQRQSIVLKHRLLILVSQIRLQSRKVVGFKLCEVDRRWQGNMTPIRDKALIAFSSLF